MYINALNIKHNYELKNDVQILKLQNLKDLHWTVSCFGFESLIRLCWLNQN